jgi:ubiquinone/menaquinone biosynthesis C-methylase UbiE
MIIKVMHEKLVYSRRIKILVRYLADILPKETTVLDVGCGDGLLAHCIQNRRPDISTEGIDILVRDKTYIPVRPFDGKNLPYLDNSFDVVRFIDVLHHTNDPRVLLKEAHRVTKRYILIKDHNADGFLAKYTLKFMDYIGNAHHGVILPFNYWNDNQWRQTFLDLSLVETKRFNTLNLYAHPFNLIFDRKLHFITLLEIQK